MNVLKENLLESALALPEEERMEVCARLASSLPVEKIRLAESLRRVEELRSGKVEPFTAETFQGKVNALKDELTEARVTRGN